MELVTIPIEKFSAEVHNLWKNQWLLLTAGDYEKGKFNTMTVAWGSLGTMWNKPFAQVVVRPTRYTYHFMEKYDSFTLTSFPKEFRKDLYHLGRKSGRDSDKIAETSLTPVPSVRVNSPSFKEAELIIECIKIYWDDFKPENFLDPSIEEEYDNDYHRIYFGEILMVRGTDKYIR